MSEKKPPRHYVRKRLLEIKEQAHKLIETADAALAEIANVETVRLLRWRCGTCGYVRFFTRAVSVEACDECAKCEGSRRVPGGEGVPLSD